MLLDSKNYTFTESSYFFNRLNFESVEDCQIIINATKSDKQDLDFDLILPSEESCGGTCCQLNKGEAACPEWALINWDCLYLPDGIVFQSNGTSIEFTTASGCGSYAFTELSRVFNMRFTHEFYDPEAFQISTIVYDCGKREWIETIPDGTGWNEDLLDEAQDKIAHLLDMYESFENRIPERYIDAVEDAFYDLDTLNDPREQWLKADDYLREIAEIEELFSLFYRKPLPAMK